VMGVAFHQHDPKFSLETLDLLAQRRWHDMLAGSGPAEMQLLGQGHEVVQLTQLHGLHPDHHRISTEPGQIQAACSHRGDVMKIRLPGS
jgi:hypothetical protein